MVNIPRDLRKLRRWNAIPKNIKHWIIKLADDDCYLVTYQNKRIIIRNKAKRLSYNEVLAESIKKLSIRGERGDYDKIWDGGKMDKKDLKKNKLSSLQKLTGDYGNICKLPFDYFNLWCCDCHLRHQVFIERVGSDRVRILMVADFTATEDRRKLEKLQKKYTRLKNKG